MKGAHGFLLFFAYHILIRLDSIIVANHIVELYKMVCSIVLFAILHILHVMSYSSDKLHTICAIYYTFEAHTSWQIWLTLRVIWASNCHMRLLFLSCGYFSSYRYRHLSDHIVQQVRNYRICRQYRFSARIIGTKWQTIRNMVIL